MKRILFIHPPVAKPGEPPAGIARLLGALRQHHIQCISIDANVAGVQYLLHQNVQAENSRTTYAAKNINRHIHEIKKGSVFKTIDHYNRIMGDLNHILKSHGQKLNYTLGLADCSHNEYSPLRSRDLIQCSENPENNPFYTYYTSSLFPEIENYVPDMIGLSINFLSQALCSFALIGLIRKAFPGMIIGIGGGLITSWMKNPGWKNPFDGLVDYCVSGPGEDFFFSLLNISMPQPYCTPLYHNTLKTDYLSPGFVLPYNTSSGCYWKQCRFCPEQAEDNRYIQIPARQVMDDLHLLKKQMAPTLIHLLDNALTPSLLKRFLKYPPGIPWYGYVRFEEFLTDLDFCIQLRKSGCVLLKLGLESGDQNVLDKMKKGIHIKSVSKILKNLEKARIPAFVYLLFGTPYESEKEANTTMNFIIEHHQSISYINAAIFNMPVSSHETSLFSTHPFYKGDLSLYVNFDHPMDWDRLKVRSFLDRTFKRHPVIAKILRKAPKIFTSNHAPFFHMDKNDFFS